MAMPSSSAGPPSGLTETEYGHLWRLALDLQACPSLEEAEAISAAARSACDSPAVARAIDETCDLALACLRQREQLRALATRDPLTGLANRRVMEETLERQCREAARLGRPLVVALLDLDRFRDYNRRHGHLAGDAVLRALATLLEDVHRDADVACRFGGDEFVVILPGVTAADALGRLELLKSRLAARLTSQDGGHHEPITASIGIAESPADGTDPAALIAAADEAMYRAKQAGGDRICLAGDQPAG
jgi:diguanylate cyclase (GGDEF)-like protein